MSRPDYVKAKVQTALEISKESPLTKQAKKLRKLKDEKEEIEEKLTQLNKQIDTLSETFAGEMESAGVESFKVEGVGSIYIQAINRPNIVDKDGFYKYLRDVGEAAIIKETIHAKTLQGWVNEHLEQGKALPESLNNFVQKRAMIRRS